MPLYLVLQICACYSGSVNTSATLIRLVEACGHLAVSRSTLYELIRAGRLRTVRVGKRGVRIPRVELERFVADGLGEAGSGEISDKADSTQKLRKGSADRRQGDGA